MTFIKSLNCKITYSDIPQIPTGPALIHQYHKIGGHTIIYKSHQFLIKRNQESTIYETIENEYHALKPYIPKYYGLIKMQVEDNYDVDGVSKVTGTRNGHGNNDNDNNNDDNDNNDNNANEPNNLTTTVEDDNADFTQGANDYTNETEGSDDSAEEGNDIPRSKDYHTVNHQPIHEPTANGTVYNGSGTNDKGESNNHDGQGNKGINYGPIFEYLVMEDLGHDIAQPFIIDLKMGTRQYGINSSPEKIQRQKLKCAHSTSKSLGTRLCGLQIWDGGKRVIYDKYFGRKLNQGGFLKYLIKFLNNYRPLESEQQQGIRLVKKLTHLITQLTTMYHIIYDIENFRFYGSSILIMYDNADDKLRIKLIDFSKSLFNYRGHQLQGKAKDYGFLKGLFNLIGIFKLMLITVTGTTEPLNEATLQALNFTNVYHKLSSVTYHDNFEFNHEVSD